MNDRNAETVFEQPGAADSSRASEVERLLRSARTGAPIDGRLRIGRFFLLEHLGSGGMGDVFSAYDPDLDRRVAIKLVRNAASDAPRVKEAQAMAKLSHPNVVHVYETGEFGDHLFIVMEFVKGASLSEWQRGGGASGPRSINEKLQAYLQAAAGLLAAHQRRLIHRDFKPDNVLVGRDGRVRVADFGLARLLADADWDDTAASREASRRISVQRGRGPTREGEGTVVGTVGYLSPEQADGREADARSDQFSFCAALYEALFGQRAFPSGTLEEYVRSVRAAAPRPPPPSEVPHVVEQAILRGMARDPARRFPTMQELIATLEAGLAPTSEPLLARADKVRLAVGLVGLVLGLQLTNTVVVWMTGSEKSLLRSLCLAFVLLLACAALLRWPLFRVRHAVRYRGMMLYYVTLAAAMLLGRAAALALHVGPNDYFVFEDIMLAALCALEALRIGPRHLIFAFVLVAYAPFVHLLPALRFALSNAILTLVTLGSVHVHMHQRLPAEGVGAAGFERRRAGARALVGLRARRRGND